ncbi:MAG: cupin domain-containing protein [Alphaproteobacteria bacterium]|nr:cupin domain-containing protein [Alphaproteobacteria bacterium]
MSLILFPAAPSSEDAESGAPAADRVVEGASAFRTWTLNESADGKTFAGIWEATPGAWRISYDEWEYCAILSGVSEVTRDGAEPVRLKAGDHLVIEPGFEGIWRVVETTRKSFVVRLP